MGRAGRREEGGAVHEPYMQGKCVCVRTLRNTQVCVCWDPPKHTSVCVSEGPDRKSLPQKIRAVTASQRPFAAEGSGLTGAGEAVA
jgi:hypothetical protein